MAYNEYKFNPFRKNQMGLLESTPRRMSNPTNGTAPAEEKGDNTVSTLIQALQLYSGLKNVGAGTPTGATPSRFSLNAPAEKVSPYSLNGLTNQPQSTQPYMTGLKSFNSAGTPTNWWDRMGQGGQQAFTRGLLAAGTSILEKSRPDSVMAAVSRGGLEGVNVYDQVKALQAQQDIARRAEERATTKFGREEGDQARKEGFLTGLRDIPTTETRTAPGVYQEYPTRDTSSSRFGLTGGSPPLTLDVPTRTEEVARPEYGILNEAADKAWRSGNIQEANTLYGLAEKMKPQEPEITGYKGVDAQGRPVYLTKTGGLGPEAYTEKVAFKSPITSDDLQAAMAEIGINPAEEASYTTENIGKAARYLREQKAKAAASNIILGADPNTGNIIIGSSKGPISPTTVQTGPLLSKTQAPLPPEQAAKVQLIEQALSYMPSIREGVLGTDPDKPTINRTDIVNMGLRTPFTKGREISTLILDAVEAKLRMESGAAVPEQEVTRMAKRFIPQAADKDTTIKLKIDNLEKFLSEAAAKVRTGRPLMGAAQPSGAAATGVKTISSDADYDALPSGAAYIDPTGKQRRKR